jgi:hypothetical protein
MSRRSVPRGLVWSIAFFGVFVGHAVTYLLLAANAAVRSTMLHATGHGYQSPTVHAGLALALIGIAGIFLGRLGRPGEPVPSVRTLAPGVAGFQILAFGAIEIAERIAAGAPLRDLAHALPVGAVVQLGVALLVAAVIRLVLGAADAVAEGAGAAPLVPPRGRVALAAVPGGGPSTPHPTAYRGRGPPR